MQGSGKSGGTFALGLKDAPRCAKMLAVDGAR